MDEVAELLATFRDGQLASVGRIMQRYAGDLDRLADYDRDLAVDGGTPASVRIDITDVESIVEGLASDFRSARTSSSPRPSAPAR